MSIGDHFAIHTFANVQIDSNSPISDHTATLTHDLVNVLHGSGQPIACEETAPSQVRLSHAAQVASTGMRQIEPGLFVSASALVDRQYSVRWELSSPNTVELLSSANPAEWLIWAIQLALLKAGATFVHGAGVERNGRAVLFPSWGGVGKTALAKGFVSDRGWKLLGDDLVILAEDGTAYGFPKPMVLYPYHREVFPEFFASGKGPIAPTSANSLLTQAAITVKPVLRRVPRLLEFARKHNPQSVLVNPSTLFGSEALATSGQTKSVIWLDRVAGIAEPRITRSDSSIASRIVGSTLREFDPHCVGVTNVAFGLGIWSFDDVYPAWARIVSSGLKGVDAWVLHIPADLPVHDVPATIFRLLDGAGILDGS